MGNMFSTTPSPPVAPGAKKKKTSLLERIDQKIDFGGDFFFGKRIIKLSLKQLQKIARRVKISIYKKRKNGIGYTKTPLTKKALKARLSKARVSYKKR
tara:strand:- start:779 stop:1072 length:294 start_codon:yes stop_codon:yes gene_type:complete